MATKRTTTDAETAGIDESDGTIDTTRRAVLAAGGAVVLGGMAGCLDTVAGTVTNTGATPAGVLSASAASGGSSPGYTHRTNRALDVGDSSVDPVPASVRAGDGILSGEVDLEGWSTTTTLEAQDYNSVRSNKRRSGVGWWEGDPDDGDGGDDADTFATVDEELSAYLADEPVIGERFTVCLPDASLPRDGPAIADELTPRRILDYLTGAAERCVADDESLYCWGQNLALHAKLSEPPADGPGVAARAVRGGVVVTNSPPVARDESSALFVPDEGDPYAPADLELWGEETRAGEVWLSPTLVCPVVARPADAPAALPATLSLRRCRHDDQYLYTGGWIVDDASLFADSCTLLVAEGPNEVVAFSPSDARGDGRARREALGRMRRARSSQGAAVYDGALDGDALVHLPDPLSDGEGLEELLSLVAASSPAARTGRNPQTGKVIKIPARDGPADGEDETALRCLVVPLDCPLAHLTDADDLSSAEKAGAYDAFLEIEGDDGDSR